MRCEQVTPYLPGFAGGELRPDTRRIVAVHIATCETCRAEAALQGSMLTALASLSDRDVPPPAYLLDAVLESVPEPSPRRVLPLLPIIPGDVARLIAEHRDAIASAAGTAIVAAGAAYALYRAVRSSRAAQPAAP